MAAPATISTIVAPTTTRPGALRVRRRGKVPDVAELVSAQLSDRERAPVFDQSMAVAQELAKSLISD